MKPSLCLARRAHLATWLIIAATLTGCASASKPTALATSQQYNGRLGLQIDSDPPQQFHASFLLQGNPNHGHLTLTSPLGSTLAVLQWSPEQTTLRQADQIRSYASVQELALAATGATVPLDALFAWLNGNAQPADGWQADLSRLAEGRIQASRTTPRPAARLRVILDTAPSPREKTS